MDLFQLKPIFSTKSLRSVLESKELGHLGDFLVNFIYTTVRIGKYGKQGSIHVWDNSLRDAMEIADLRSALGKKTKPDRVADAAEALVAYAYFTELMNLEEMIEYLTKHLNKSDFVSTKVEKEACAKSFSSLLKKIVAIADEHNRFI